MNNIYNLKQIFCLFTICTAITACSGGGSDHADTPQQTTPQVVDALVKTYSVSLKEVRINQADNGQAKTSGLPLNSATVTVK